MATWAIENQTEFAVERTWKMDKTGDELWIVVVKGTYRIEAAGGLALHDKQESPCVVAEYFGEPGVSSVKYESDFVLGKPGTDVIVNAQCYAPQGRPVPVVPIELRVGTGIVKRALVTGERRFTNAAFGVGLTEPRPFVTMPLCYERAFGGAGERRNPIGVGYSADRGQLKGTPAPNIEYPEATVAADLKSARPCGLGSIAADWMPRLSHAGTFDEAWSETQKPLLPKDYDNLFNHCAPPDLQSRRPLVGGEQVMLRNLSPRGIVQFTLPKIRLAFDTEFPSRRLLHEGALHSVIIEPDAERVMLVWHSAIRAGRNGHELLNTIVSHASA